MKAKRPDKGAQGPNAPTPPAPPASTPQATDATLPDGEAPVARLFGPPALIVKAPRHSAQQLGQIQAQLAAGYPETFVPSPARTFSTRLSERALVGLAGDIIRALRPYTEAGDAAMLAHLLTAFGLAVGSGPHVPIGAEPHPARLFSLIVGPTGRGRKGTAWSAVRPIFERAAPDLTARITSTVQSGEALVEAVRDGNGEDDPGVLDKRLLVFEPEFSNVISVKGRQGSIITGIIRAAWDHGDLHNHTKKNPGHATRPHVSIIDHITPEELRKRLDESDAFNGFLNRFLFIHAERARVLPLPEAPPEVLLEKLANCLSHAIETAQHAGPIGMTAEAEAMWRVIYEGLSSTGGGLVGALAERAAPYVRRLALIYALLAERRVVDVQDLEAAIAVWNYSVATVHHIFGGRTGNKLADRIYRALRDRGEMTRTQISALLGNNRSTIEIADALQMLHASGQAVCESRPTGGLPTEVWRLAAAPGDDDGDDGKNETRGVSQDATPTSSPSSPYFVPDRERDTASAGAQPNAYTVGQRVTLDGELGHVYKVEPDGTTWVVTDGRTITLVAPEDSHRLAPAHAA